MRTVSFTTWLDSEFKRTGKLQKELAQYLGQSITTISRYANGKLVPRMERIERMEDFFETPHELKWSVPLYSGQVQTADGFIYKSNSAKVDWIIAALKTMDEGNLQRVEDFIISLTPDAAEDETKD